MQKKNSAYKLREIAEQSIQRDLMEILNPKQNQQSAKGVDAFGRTKEQVEMARLMRAGKKGIRIK